MTKLSILAVPAYLMSDAHISALIRSAEEVMSETEADEVTVSFVAQAVEELRKRGQTVTLVDGKFRRG